MVESIRFMVILLLADWSIDYSLPQIRTRLELLNPARELVCCTHSDLTFSAHTYRRIFRGCSYTTKTMRGVVDLIEPAHAFQNSDFQFLHQNKRGNRVPRA